MLFVEERRAETLTDGTIVVCSRLGERHETGIRSFEESAPKKPGCSRGIVLWGRNRERKSCLGEQHKCCNEVEHDGRFFRTQ